MAVDKNGQAISVGDKVTIKAMRIEGRVVAAGPDTVDIDIGEPLPRRGVAAGPGFSAVVKMERVSMAASFLSPEEDAVLKKIAAGDPLPLKGLDAGRIYRSLQDKGLIDIAGGPGDGYRVTSNGRQAASMDAVVSMARAADTPGARLMKCWECDREAWCLKRKLQGRQLEVYLCDDCASKLADPAAMSRPLDAVDFARSTRCPYCTKSVSLHARTIAEHRAPSSATCDGSNRRVAEFDYAGRAVLEAQSFGFSPGQRVRGIGGIVDGAEGEVVRDLNGGIEMRITKAGLMPSYAPVGQVVSVRYNYVSPA